MKLVVHGVFISPTIIDKVRLELEELKEFTRQDVKGVLKKHGSSEVSEDFHYRAAHDILQRWKQYGWIVCDKKTRNVWRWV